MIDDHQHVIFDDKIQNSAFTRDTEKKTFFIDHHDVVEKKTGTFEKRIQFLSKRKIVSIAVMFFVFFYFFCFRV